MLSVLSVRGQALSGLETIAQGHVFLGINDLALGSDNPKAIFGFIVSHRGIAAVIEPMAG